MTDPLGGSQILPYLEGLAAKGWKIELMSCEKQAAMASRGEHIRSHALAAGISWFPVTYRTGIPLLSARMNVSSLARMAARRMKAARHGIIHARSYIPAIIGSRLSKKYHARLLFDMRGFWADERVEGGLWNLSNPLFRLVYRHFKKKEKMLFNTADGIISLTQAAVPHIQKIAGSEVSQGIAVIPCCCDTHLFDAENIATDAREKLKQHLMLDGRHPVMTYLGSFGTWYMFDEMLDFFARLLYIHPEAVFLIITPDRPAYILDKMQQKGIAARSARIVRAERNEVPLYLSLGDFTIFFIKPVFSKKASSPTKLAEVMSLGIPVVCNSGIGDVDQIIKQSGAGILVSEFNDDSYDKVIAAIDEITQKSPADIRQYAENEFSLSGGIDIYHKVYCRLSGLTNPSCYE
jgi:glycosyltransferase involved in cell wall biosynthesis